MDGAPKAVVERLRVATNAHDLDALVGCFSADYRNETPAHPGRSFEGRAQVRANWTQIFAGVPDITAEITASVVDRDVVWSEWGRKGTRRDGAPHAMRGVIVFGTADDAIPWARFYLEPVDSDAENADQAVRRLVPTGPGGAPGGGSE